MKLRRDDNVMVMVGRYKGKTGRILAVIPSDGKVLVEGINIAKRHTKPSDKNPRGGIIELTKPIDVSKVMVLDPATGLPARIGYTINADGTKERTFKVSSQRQAAAKAKPAKAEIAAGAKAKTTSKQVPAAKKVTAPKKAPAKKVTGDTK